MVRSKRILDVLVAGGLLALTAPVMLIAAVGIKLNSAGPILFRSRRIGCDRRRELRDEPYHGREFVMYKLRTMHVHTTGRSAPIAAWRDARVFPWGRVLRATKIDELPQLLNVLRGEMSIVGPRPEAPEIVREYYRFDDVATLRALPGLTSPGTLYYYTHCETMLAGAAFMEVYAQRLLPLKLSLDRVYLSHTTTVYDCRVILRTLMVIAGRVIGVRRFPEPPELREVAETFRPVHAPLSRSAE